MEKNKAIKWLLIIFGIIVLMRLIAVWFFVPAPSAFSDEYTYIKVARSLFYNLESSIHGIPFYRYPPLYSIVISIAYLFDGSNGGMVTIYFVMKCINAVLGALVIFPAYLLSREFFRRKKSLWIAVLCTIIPSVTIMTHYILSENLFFPLFLFAFYFTYKSFIRYEWRWGLLAGFFIGLCLMTRMIIVPFLGAVILTAFIGEWKRKESNMIKNSRNIEIFWNLCRIFLVIGIVILPWIIYSSGQMGSNYFVKPPFDIEAFLTIITLPFVYLAYLMFASGIIPFFTFFPITKLKGKKKYFWRFAFITISCFVIFLGIRQMYAHHLFPSIFPWIRERPIGRYVSFLIPLALLMGFINYNKATIKVKKLIWLFIGLLWFTGLFLFSFPLFPINNSDLTLLGSVQFYLTNAFHNTNIDVNIIMVMAIITLICIGIAFVMRSLLLREVIIFLIILFLIGGHLGVIVSSYNSISYWANGEAMKFGLWVNKHVPPHSQILIDERDCDGQILKSNQTLICESIGDKVSTPSTIMGVWMNNDIYIGDIKDLNIPKDYIITRHTLNKTLLHKSFSGIKIYET